MCKSNTRKEGYYNMDLIKLKETAESEIKKLEEELSKADEAIVKMEEDKKKLLQSIKDSKKKKAEDEKEIMAKKIYLRGLEAMIEDERKEEQSFQDSHSIYENQNYDN